MGEASGTRWTIRLHGITDSELFGFNADGWELRHGNPARGTLLISTRHDGTAPNHSVAQFIADVLAFDHDAPIDAAPVGLGPNELLTDPAISSPVRPVSPLSTSSSTEYWENVRLAHIAAARNRFGADSFLLRYDGSDRAPSLEFSKRFNEDQRHRLGLYAMAARQADVLSEYLCLYRVLESEDGSNGVTWSLRRLGDIATHDFGHLELVEFVYLAGTSSDPIAVEVFAAYRRLATELVDDLHDDGVDVPRYLYDLRNGIAHGKSNTIVGGDSDRLAAVSSALPVVKLLARLAIEA